MRMNCGFILLLATVCLFHEAEAENSSVRRRTYDVLHYSLDLHIEERKQTVEGTATLRFTPVEEIRSMHIDASDMEVTSVALMVKGEPVYVAHTLGAQGLVIQPQRVLTPADTGFITLAYKATPRLGLYFVAPDSAYPDRPFQVWSQGEPEQNHFWFPCYDKPDDKATTEMKATVNEEFKVVSNGSLLDVASVGDKKTYHWFNAKPIASYQISVVVGKYETIQSSYKNIPVTYNVYADRTADALRSFGRTTDMMAFFSEKLRFDYPWSQYAQTVVTDFIWGGMENTSAATLNDRTLHSERAAIDVSSENLVAHELAHQWFGDLVTCNDWSHAWLNEGFASYFTNLWNEHDKGRDEFFCNMAETQHSLVSEDRGIKRRPTVTSAFDEPIQVFDSRIYGRGSSILHMLRYTLGETLFWRGIQRYVQVNQYRSATTDDFRQAMEEATNTDLSWFFDQWVTQAGYPVFNVSSEYHEDAGKVVLHIRQSQEVDSLTPLYRVPMDVVVSTSSGKVRERIIVEPKREQLLEISSAERPLNVSIDPESWILKSLQHSKSKDEWLHQLRNGSVAERLAAVRELADLIESVEVQGALRRTMRHDVFWRVRKEAISVLDELPSNVLFAELQPALNDPDPRVRTAAVKQVGTLPSDDAKRSLEAVLAGDSSFAVAAAVLTSLVAVDKNRGMEYCERGLAMKSHNDIVAVAAVHAMGTLKSDDARERLLELTRYGKPREIRIAAIDALATNWSKDSEVRHSLEHLVQDKQHHVRRKAIERLGAVGDDDSRELLQSVVERESDALIRRDARNALRVVEQRLKQ